MVSDIKDRAKFDFVRYASVWEDADILYEALNPNENGSILSIASGGDNALALLAGGAKVLALDLSLAQIACTELKWVGFQYLDYEKLLAFLGVLPCDSREKIFEELVPKLSEKTAGYWSQQLDVVQKGIIHCGKFEKFFGLFREKILPFIHSKKRIDQLLEEKSCNSRKTFYDKKWNNLRWRALFKIFFSRFVMGHFGRDPEFFRYVEGSVADRILSRTRYALTELPTYDNPYLEYILKGNYINAYPRFLREENFQKIRDNAGGLILFHGSIESAIEENPEIKFTGFNLSDIFEYLSVEHGQKICEQLISASQPGARLAYWNMLAPRRFSVDMPALVYQEDLSKKLFSEDKAFFYSDFIVEEVANVGG